MLSSCYLHAFSLFPLYLYITFDCSERFLTFVLFLPLLYLMVSTVQHNFPRLWGMGISNTIFEIICSSVTDSYPWSLLTALPFKFGFSKSNKYFFSHICLVYYTSISLQVCSFLWSIYFVFKSYYFHTF